MPSDAHRDQVCFVLYDKNGVPSMQIKMINLHVVQVPSFGAALFEANKHGFCYLTVP